MEAPPAPPAPPEAPPDSNSTPEPLTSSRKRSPGRGVLRGQVKDAMLLDANYANGGGSGTGTGGGASGLDSVMAEAFRGLSASEGEVAYLDGKPYSVLVDEEVPRRFSNTLIPCPETTVLKHNSIPRQSPISLSATLIG